MPQWEMALVAVVRYVGGQGVSASRYQYLMVLVPASANEFTSNPRYLRSGDHEESRENINLHRGVRVLAYCRDPQTLQRGHIGWLCLKEVPRL